MDKNTWPHLQEFTGPVDFLYPFPHTYTETQVNHWDRLQMHPRHTVKTITGVQPHDEKEAE